LVLFSVCNKKKDLLFIVESTNSIGQAGFSQIKHFIKQIVNAFDISPPNTHVAFMSVNERAKINFGFDRGSLSKSNVMEKIDLVRFTRGGSAYIHKAFQAVDDLVYGGRGGTRETVNKVR
jgi:hypothetical protein